MMAVVMVMMGCVQEKFNKRRRRKGRREVSEYDDSTLFSLVFLFCNLFPRNILGICLPRVGNLLSIQVFVTIQQHETWQCDVTYVEMQAKMLRAAAAAQLIHPSWQPTAEKCQLSYLLVSVWSCVLLYFWSKEIGREARVRNLIRNWPENTGREDGLDIGLNLADIALLRNSTICMGIMLAIPAKPDSVLNYHCHGSFFVAFVYTHPSAPYSRRFRGGDIVDHI